MFRNSPYSWQEGLGPAGLPKSVEEVWRREWIVIWMWCRYVWLLYMRCSIAMLFTCMLVFSCPIGNGGCTCETWNGGTNNKILGGPRQTRTVHVGEGWHEVQSDPRRKPWQMYSLSAPRRQPLKYVWSIWDITYAKRRKGNWNVMWHLHYICPCLIFYTHDCSLSVFALSLLIVYFSQVKNKPWLSWVYSWIQHLREQA
jgi:hypothetical protein